EPALSITKKATPTTYSKVGEVISYKIVATNTGNVTLSNVSVEDKPALEGFSCSPSIPATLAPGASITCTGTHTITQADLDAGKIEDTACTTATGAKEACASTEQKAEPKPKLSITKKASPSTYRKVGDVISYEIVASNTGNVTLSGVSVEDKPALDNFKCSPSIPATLAPGASITCTGTHTITQADLDAGKIEDTACTTASGAKEACAS